MKKLNHSLLQAAIVVAIALAFIMPGSAATLNRQPATYTHIQSTSAPKKASSPVLEESFEDTWVADSDGDLAPPGWEVHKTNQQSSPYPGYFNQIGEVVFSDGTVTPPEGSYQAFVYWQYDHQDEWLVSPVVTIGSGADLSFMFYGHYGSVNLDHYYVKLSPSGGSAPEDFTVTLWDATELPEQDNHYNTPVDIPITGYSGDVRIAWNYVDGDGLGLWYATFIDQVVLEGGSSDGIPPVTTIDLNGTLVDDIYTSNVKVTLTATDDSSGVNFTMYKVDGGAYAKYTAPFIVSADGEHTVAYYSVDFAGNTETEKTATFTIQHPISITIKGGLGITATIKNSAAEATDVSGTIEVTGFAFPKSKPFSATIEAGADYKAKSMVFGFGKIGINVTVGDITKTASGTLVLFFVLGVA